MADLEADNDLLRIWAVPGQQGFGQRYDDRSYGILINPGREAERYHRTVVLANELGHAHEAMVTGRGTTWWSSGRSDLRFENDVRTIRGCGHRRRFIHDLFSFAAPMCP